MAYGDYFPDFVDDPYGMGSGSYGTDYTPPSPLDAHAGLNQRKPTPKRLTLEELQALLSEEKALPKPVPFTSARALTGDDRTQAQQAGLWQGLAALGATISGHQDPDAVAHVQAAQQGVVDRVNARQQAAYDAAAQESAAGVAQEQQRQKIGALYGTYEKIAATEPQDSPFAADAADAAKLGDMSKLQTMLGQVPQRAAARQAGLDPDAWSTNQRLQGELQAALEAKKQAAVQEATLPGKIAEAQQVGDIKSAQELAREKAVKLAPGWQAPLQLEPLSYVAAAAAARREPIDYVKQKAEAEAAVKDAHAKSQQLTPRLGVSQGRWGLITTDPLTGRVTFKEADGQPQKQGKYHYVTIDGVPYAQDTEHPEQGAFPVKLHKPGETAPWAAPKPAAPAASPAPASAPAPGASPTSKLSAIKDPATAAKVQRARASGYSDSEIAAFLGIH